MSDLSSCSLFVCLSVRFIGWLVVFLFVFWSLGCSYGCKCVCCCYSSCSSSCFCTLLYHAQPSQLVTTSWHLVGHVVSPLCGAKGRDPSKNFGAKKALRQRPGSQPNDLMVGTGIFRGELESIYIMGCVKLLDQLSGAMKGATGKPRENVGNLWTPRMRYLSILYLQNMAF